MHGSLPVYCETLLNATDAFPAEPVNTITSFAPVIFGALALHYLIRHRQSDAIAYALAILTILTGLGSMSWHSLRTELTLVVDALPGLIYFVIVVSIWLYRVGGRYASLVAAAAVVALIVLVPPASRQQTQIMVLTTVAVLAAGLLVATRYRKRQAFVPALAMVGAAVVAASLRTLDLSVCDVIPIGTHFFWHIFLGVAAYAGVRMVISLQPDNPDARVRPSGAAAMPPT